MAEKITVRNGRLEVPDNPIIPYIEGDGTGPDIWYATRLAIDAAVLKAYSGRRRIEWKEVLAGEKAFKATGEWLPRKTLDDITEHVVAIKGPLTTPVGEGIRSLNVTIRQELDLYACIRPVKWIKGTPSPVVHPEWLDVVIFRENTEDIYAGIEWMPGSDKARKVIGFLNGEMGCKIDETASIGVKPITKSATQRLMRKAMEYAMRNHRHTVTIVHKGNIMKYTEGAFMKWGYALAEREFGDSVFTWEHSSRGQQARAESEGKVIIKDVIADAFLQQILTRPEEYSVIATLNLNGDYISDALAAIVGGIGIAPGGNINYETGHAVFEATHGTAPKYAGQDKVNPGSVILSGALMFDYLGWGEAAACIYKSLEKTIMERKVTYDFHRLMDGAHLLKTSEFGDALVDNIKA